MASMWMSLNQAKALANNKINDIILAMASTVVLTLLVNEILCK
jgi:hypothetical protein